jgi:pimeloyl-ACP methyl ester carboxylesterase
LRPDEAWEVKGAVETRTVQSDSVELWAERIGCGASQILFLAGATMQAIAWEDSFLQPLIDAGHSVIRFDWRDTGLSTWRSFRDHPYSIETLIEDAWRILDVFEAEVADLVGFSMGGCVAQLMALRHPERVRSLNLIASGFASAIHIERSPRTQRLWEALASSDGDPVQTLVEQWSVLYGEAADFDPDAWRARAERWVGRGQNLRCPHLRLGPQVFGLDRSQSLRSLEVPALVVHGDDDSMFPLPHGEAIAATLRRAHLVVLPGRGHDLFLDTSVSELIVDHLEVVKG